MESTARARPDGQRGSHYMPTRRVLFANYPGFGRKTTRTVPSSLRRTATIRRERGLAAGFRHTFSAFVNDAPGNVASVSRRPRGPSPYSVTTGRDDNGDTHSTIARWVSRNSAVGKGMAE